MLGRVIAVLLLLVGIVGIGIAIVGVLFGFRVVAFMFGYFWKKNGFRALVKSCLASNKPVGFS